MADLTKLGRYELRRVLGRGAMGVVYEGFDPNLNRRVAVKTILRSAALDEETERAYSERFVKEAQAVGRLNHQNIVQVYDFGEQNEVAYIVMEFIEGRELRSFFEAKEKFTLPEAVRIMSELLDALDFAHEAGVIHRDIKPANVMLDAQRRVKLADFGVARVQDSDRSAAGTMVGTPAFMSPEQISGGKIDRRTDIFSAGVVFYQLLTGEQPFKGEGAWTVAKKIMQDDPPRPSELVQTVPAAFDSIVNHALAKAPAQRFARASEFASALRATQTPANQSAPLATPAIAMPRSQASEAEVEFWKAIQASTDAAEFEFYLEQFPDGTYAQLARHKIAKLKEPAEASRKEAEEAAKRAAEEKAKREAEQKARAEAEAREQARKAAEEKARREAEERARREAEAKAKQEAEAKARREALEQARRAAEEKAKREAEEQARRAAEEKARRAAEEKAKREAEEQARRAAAEQARRDAEEKARREAAEKAKREAEALARLKAQEAAQAKAKVARVDEDATVAMRMPAATPAVSAPPTAPAAQKRSFIAPALIAAVVVAGGAVAWFALKRSPEPAPSPVAAKPAAPAVDIEKIKRETEERIRREYADKSAAEQAKAAKAAAEKEIAEKQAAAKAAAAEKLAAEKAAAEKAKLASADKAAAEKAASEKAAAQKQAAEKAAAEKVAAEKAAADKLAADKAAAEKAAAEKVAAEKAAADKLAAEKGAAAKAAAAKPGWPSVGDRWVYEVRDADHPDKRFQGTVEIVALGPASIREVFRPSTGGQYGRTWGPGAKVAGMGSPGFSVFSPFLRAFQEIRAGESWSNVEFEHLGNCSSNANFSCSVQVRVAGKERVSVRAGSFDTWKIVAEMLVRNANGGGGTSEMVFWYSEEAKRTVKSQFRNRGANGPPSIDSELVSYTPAGK